MSEYVKKAIYLGVTLATGAAGYLLGKYKTSRKWVSTTALGVTLLMCAPRGFDLAEKYLILNNDLKKQELYKEIKKDSINAVLEMNYPKDKLSSYLNKTATEIANINNNIKMQYASLANETERKYKKALDSTSNQNKIILNTINDKISEQNNLVTTKLNSIQNNINHTTTPSNSNLSKLSNTNSKLSLDHYLIDVNKTYRSISIYEIYSNGTINSLNIASKASFPTNGGPENGEYILQNKGSRTGELFPGFIAINDPIGISGAGENNQYLKDITNGALTNKTGLRVPNEIYEQLAQIVDTKETTISIHD